MSTLAGLESAARDLDPLQGQPGSASPASAALLGREEAVLNSPAPCPRDWSVTVSPCVCSVLSRAQRGLTPAWSFSLCPTVLPCHAPGEATSVPTSLPVYPEHRDTGTPLMSPCVPGSVILGILFTPGMWPGGVVLTPRGPSWTCSAERKSPVVLPRYFWSLPSPNPISRYLLFSHHILTSNSSAGLDRGTVTQR